MKFVREALLNLHKRNHIIITKADKGAISVIMDVNPLKANFTK